MNIVITREGAEPVVIENAKGVLALVRMEGGISKVVVGELSTFELALMIKSITAGDDYQNEILRKAWAMAAKLPMFNKEDITETSHAGDGLNDPFAELAGAE